MVSSASGGGQSGNGHSVNHWHFKIRAFLVSLTCISHLAGGLSSDSEFYLSDTCNGQGWSESGRVEASSSLTYSNNMNCVFTVTGTHGVGLLLTFQRFEVEESADGRCRFDNLTLYDGPSVGSPVIASAPLCGRRNGVHLTTSTPSVTMHFRTDGTGVDRGFDMVFQVYTSAPCSSDQLQCGGGQCVNKNVKCNGLNQCGDNTDEVNCTGDADEDPLHRESEPQVDPGIVSGAVIGACAFTILVIFGIWRFYKWKQYKKFLKRIENEEAEKAEYNEISFRSVDSRTDYPLSNYYQNDS